MMPLRAVFLLASIFVATTAGASADPPLSIYLQSQSVDSATNVDIGSPLIDAGIGYDLGPKLPVPVRARFDVNESFIPGAYSKLNDAGFGIDVHLTTPLYAGIGGSVDFVNEIASFACPAAVPVGGGTIPCGMPKTNTVGFGSRFFVGARVLAVPGFTLSLEGSYREAPSILGDSPSGFGIGLRANL